MKFSIHVIGGVLTGLLLPWGEDEKSQPLNEDTTYTVENFFDEMYEFLGFLAGHPLTTIEVSDIGRSINLHVWNVIAKSTVLIPEIEWQPLNQFEYDRYIKPHLENTILDELPF